MVRTPFGRIRFRIVSLFRNVGSFVQCVVVVHPTAQISLAVVRVVVMLTTPGCICLRSNYSVSEMSREIAMMFGDDQT